MSNTETKTTTATDMYSVDPRNIIVVEGFNVRQDYGDIEGLAQSIASSGVKVPLRAYRSKEDKEKFMLVDGHRRLRAAMSLVELGIELKVPVILETRNYSEEERILDMLRTNDGLQLTSLEKAEVVKRMNQHDWTDQMISEKIGKSITAVGNMLKVANAPQKVKNFITDGKVEFSVVVKEIVKCKGDSKMLIEKLSSEVEKNDSGPATGKKKKVTAKSLRSSEEKVNSISEFKKFDKNCRKQGIEITKMQAEYSMILEVIEGKLNRKDFERLFTTKK